MPEFKRRSTDVATDVATDEIKRLNLRGLDTRRARDGVSLNRLDDGMEFRKDDEVETLKTSLRAYVLGEAKPAKEELSQPGTGTAESKETPEFSLEKFTKANYSKAIGALTDGEKTLYDPETAKIKAPSEEEALARVNKLSPGQWEVVKGFKRPMLVIVPEGLPYGKFVDNLNKGTRTRNDVVITDSRKKQFALQDEALGIKEDGTVTDWTVGIAEGADESEGESGILEDLTNNWEQGEQARGGAVLVDHPKFALMEKQAIMEGRRLDRVNWSVLSRRDDNKKTVCKDGLVSGGDCGGVVDYVAFHEAGPVDDYRRARFRAVVIAPKS